MPPGVLGENLGWGNGVVGQGRLVSSDHEDRGQDVETHHQDQDHKVERRHGTSLSAKREKGYTAQGLNSQSIVCLEVDKSLTKS